MAIFGIGSFETRKQKQARQLANKRLIFPYGEKQEEKIIAILKQLFPCESKEVIIFNYIITKQKLMEKEFLDSNDINELDKQYMSKIDSSILIALAKLDLQIDENLNYPSINEITGR